MFKATFDPAHSVHQSNLIQSDFSMLHLYKYNSIVSQILGSLTSSAFAKQSIAVYIFMNVQMTDACVCVHLSAYVSVFLFVFVFDRETHREELARERGMVWDGVAW